MALNASWSIVVAVAVLMFGVFIYDPDNLDPESIRGKRVLITGASSGIGEELAYHYCQFGASVFLTARRSELLGKVAERCRQHGAERVEYSVADMAIVGDRHRLVDQVRQRFDGKLDHLILNHAIYTAGKWSGSGENMAQLQRDLQVNFVSYVDVASKSLPMLSESRGSIGVMSSFTGKIAVPLYASYSAGKSALLGFFNAWRQELMAKDVDVSITTFVLGYVATETALSNAEKMRAETHWYEYVPSPMSVNETAAVLVRGVANRVYEVQFPFTCRLSVFLHKVAPGYLENLIGSTVARSPAY